MEWAWARHPLPPQQGKLGFLFFSSFFSASDYANLNHRNCIRRPSLGTHLGNHVHLQGEGLHIAFTELQSCQTQLCCVTVYWGKEMSQGFLAGRRVTELLISFLTPTRISSHNGGPALSLSDWDSHSRLYSHSGFSLFAMDSFQVFSFIS